jgi:hypothetical protein
MVVERVNKFRYHTTNLKDYYSADFDLLMR